MAPVGGTTARPVQTDERARRKRRRMGSDFTSRQIAVAVREVRQVVAHLPGGCQVRGYIYGGDDYHWGLVDADAPTTTHLVHKTTPLSITSESTSDPQIRKVVDPYRQSVLRNHFGHRPAASTLREK